MSRNNPFNFSRVVPGFVKPNFAHKVYWSAWVVQRTPIKKKKKQLKKQKQKQKIKQNKKPKKLKNSQFKLKRKFIVLQIYSLG